MNFIKNVISTTKSHITASKSSLNLSYITPRIIAMAYPSENIFQTLYRNDIQEVSSFLNTHHYNNYLIFNLSGIPYNESYFNGKVLTYQIDDHNPPTLQQLFTICQQSKMFLTENDSNVVVYHCLCGKGRTGTVISCMLLYCGVCDSAQKAMEYFAIKRFGRKDKGVNNLGQIRYVYYFDLIMNGMFFPSLQTQIQPVYDINMVYDVSSQLSTTLNVNYFDLHVINIKNITITSIHELIEGANFVIKIKNACLNNEITFVNGYKHYVYGDVKVTVYKNGYIVDKWCWIWFNVSMLFFRDKHTIKKFPYNLVSYEKYYNTFDYKTNEGKLTFAVNAVDPYTMQNHKKNADVKVEIEYEKVNMTNFSNSDIHQSVNCVNNALDYIRKKEEGGVGFWNSDKIVFGMMYKNDITEIVLNN